MAHSPATGPPPGASSPADPPAEAIHLPVNVLEHIFSALGPRDLALASAVASPWRAAAAAAPWADFYAAAWPVAPRAAAAASASSWAAAFAARMALARGFRGRPRLDHAAPGHASGVRCAKILSGIFDTEADLALTGSVDRTLALWNLETGTRLAASALHAGTVRCVAADGELLLTGCSDHRIRAWRRAGGDATDPAAAVGFPFLVDGPRVVLPGGHAGPVSALELAPTALFSGSWDYCVRVWSRSGGGGSGGGSGEWPALECAQALHFDDWVTSLALVGGGHRLLVGAGREVHVVDPGAGAGAVPLFSLNSGAEGGGAIAGVHLGAGVTAVAGTADGRLAFYATADGAIVAADLRAPPGGGAGRVLELTAASAVTGLVWDHPWLAASLQNGEVLLLDAEAAVGGYCGGGGVVGGRGVGSDWGGLKGGHRGARGPFTYRSVGGAGPASRGAAAWPCRAMAAGVPGGAQCVALSGRWLAAGFEGGAVAAWDFGRAGEALREAEALRAGRRRERERRQAAAAAERKGRGKTKKGGDKPAAAAAEREAAEAAARPPLPQSAPLPIPRPAGARGGPSGGSSSLQGAGVASARPACASPGGNTAGGRGAAAARVPAPISLGRSPGAGGEDIQARWAVLRMSRSASSGSVGQRPGATTTAQQQQGTADGAPRGDGAGPSSDAGM